MSLCLFHWCCTKRKRTCLKKWCAEQEIWSITSRVQKVSRTPEEEHLWIIYCSDPENCWRNKHVSFTTFTSLLVVFKRIKNRNANLFVQNHFLRSPQNDATTTMLNSWYHLLHLDSSPLFFFVSSDKKTLVQKTFDLSLFPSHDL